MRDIIYGLYDKTSNGYLGYFKTEEDVKKEMLIQKERIQNEYSCDDMIILDNKVVLGDKTILAIHQLILR